MSFKISKADNDYSFVDINSLVKNLNEAEQEDWTVEDVEKDVYAKQGIIPARVAKASAENFGLRKAFFDVWKPADENKMGVWKLQKEADGSEWIIRDDEDNSGIKFS